MKKLIVLSLILISGTAMAQSTYGLKGGLNYGATGDYENYGQIIGDASTVAEGKEKTGFHLGTFAKFWVDLTQITGKSIKSAKRQ